MKKIKAIFIWLLNNASLLVAISYTEEMMKTFSISAESMIPLIISLILWFLSGSMIVSSFCVTRIEDVKLDVPGIAKMADHIEFGDDANILVFGNQGTGMVRQYIKPYMKVTGENLLNALLINGKYAYYETHFSNMEIYIALRRCQSLLFVPTSDSEIEKLNTAPFSARQGYCIDLALEFMMKNKYNHALHEFEDCIADYGRGKTRVLTSNEMVLYNSILTCFIARLEEQSDDVQVMRMVAEKTEIKKG